MHTVFQVLESDILNLEIHNFRPLLNALLMEEARRYGIPPLCVEITKEDNVSDGGVDAKVQHELTLPDTCRIPFGLSVWQYKASAAPKDLVAEAQKPGIQEAILQNGSYCVVVNQSYSPTMRQKREKALTNAFDAHDKKPREKLLTASEIAEWVSDFPPLAAQVLNFQLVDDFYTFRQWSELPETGATIEFQLNDSRRSNLTDISASLSDESIYACRLIAADGLGKTRAVLETIRANALEDSTVYATTPDAVPDNFFHFVQSRPSIAQVVLVVDECNDDEFRSLLNRTTSCKGRVKLIAIGSGELPLPIPRENGVRFLALDRLNNEIVRKIVFLTAPSLPLELHLFIAQSVDGNVKLATALAESLSLNREIPTTSQLMALPKVEFILRSIVNEEEHKAMYVLSLLKFIGLDDEAGGEAQELAKFVGINFGDLKTTANKLKKRGLVIKRGRFRFVTPNLLAVWFAKEVWESRSDEIRSTLLDALPSLNARHRLLERLADIGEEQYAHPFVDAFWGEDSEYANIASFENRDIAQLFKILANAAPIACCNSLERILNRLSKEQLLEWRKGREAVISTIDHVFLRYPGTFFPAARMLLRLAEAENDRFLSATNLWREIFFAMGGIGPFPAWERHVLIEEAISPTKSIETRLLGIQAIEFAFISAPIGMDVVRPRGQFAEQWRPQTQEDVWKTYRSALKLLDQVMQDPDNQVMEAAKICLFQHGISLLDTPLKTDILHRLELEVFKPQSPQLAKMLRDILETMLEGEGNILSESEQNSISAWRDHLLGNSYHDRLERWLGNLTSWDRRDVYGTNPRIDLNQIITDLAKEGCANRDVLCPELPWLTSLPTLEASQFALALGTQDTTHLLWSDLVTCLPQDQAFVSQYLFGQWQIGNENWVKEVIKQWVQDDPQNAGTILSLLLKLGGSDERAQWILDLIRRNWLHPEHLGYLWQYRWVEPLSESAFRDLLEPLSNSDQPQCTGIALGLIAQWIKVHPEHSVETARTFVLLLDRHPAPKLTHLSQATMAWEYWSELCIYYLKAFPTEIVRGAINFVTQAGMSDKPLLVLREALILSPELVWPIIGESLLDENHRFWPHTVNGGNNFGMLGMGDLLQVVNISLLTDWAELHKPKAHRILAIYAKVEENPLPPLARELIIRFGNDETTRENLYPIHHRTTSAMGRWSDRWKDMLKTVQTWQQDDNEAVRVWAHEVEEIIKRDISQYETRDDERDLLYG